MVHRNPKVNQLMADNTKNFEEINLSHTNEIRLKKPCIKLSTQKHINLDHLINPRINMEDYIRKIGKLINEKVNTNDNKIRELIKNRHSANDSYIMKIYKTICTKNDDFHTKLRQKIIGRDSVKLIM